MAPSWTRRRRVRSGDSTSNGEEDKEGENESMTGSIHEMESGESSRCSRHKGAFNAYGLLGLWLAAIVLVESFVVFFRSVALYFVVPVWFVACSGLAMGRWRHAPSATTLHSFAVVVYIVGCTVLVVLFTLGVTVTLRNDFSDAEFVVMGPRSATSIAFSTYRSGYSAFNVQYRAKQQNSEETTAISVPINDVAILENLSPSTKYDYQIVFQPGAVPGPQGSFRTLPDPTQTSSSRIKFASSSCANRFESFGGAPLEGFSRIAQNDPDLDFLLFLGDFVYVDEPWSAGYGFDAKRYDANYRATLGEANARQFFANYPAFFMTDDHEYINDYAGGNATSLYKTATKSWQRHIGNVNPGRPNGRAGLYYNFTAAHSQFFVLDTRSNRDEMAGVILGESQLQDVLVWLAEAQTKYPQGLKFVVTPVSITRNSKTKNANWNCGCPNCISPDAASAQGLQCPNERKQLLDFCVAQNITKVVFLSGDTHVPAVWQLTKPPNDMYEFSASPLQGGALDLTVGETEPDAKIFEQTRLAQAWMVLQVDTDLASNHSSLLIKIYGGGPSIIARIICVFFITSSLFIASYGGLFLGERKKRNAFVGAGAAIFIAAVCAILITHARTDAQFQQPIFEYKL